jgi:hypothetical protein
MDVSSPKTKITSTTFNNSLCNKATGSNPCCGTQIPIQASQVIYVRAIPASGPDAVSCSGTGCDGTVNVSGTVHGQVTLGVDDDIVVVDDIKYSQSPPVSDVLGLVATNNVAVCHQTTPCNTPNRIDAAILALNHSFYVQTWNQGSTLGTLTVNGVIAQKYRGAVGTFSGSPPVTNHGYDKDYHYDSRLKIMSPPYFLSPVQSAWQKNSYSEIKPTATP